MKQVCIEILNSVNEAQREKRKETFRGIREKVGKEENKIREKNCKLKLEGKDEEWRNN